MAYRNGSPGPKAGRAKTSLAHRIQVSIREYTDCLKEFQRFMIEVLLLFGFLGFLGWWLQHEFHQVPRPISPIVEVRK
jgi:hypothetical protein